MPLNTLRLNYQPSSHPNDRIVFIKPIPRPAAEKDDYERAELVLQAIAAQCLPVMKNHHLSVTTLEEHEPNPEFIGRNFNNGEIIQLVIKSKSGAWLPLNMIQMVMMHELAHNTHMNHAKGFWQTRNLYAIEMQQLWGRGYTGEGLWGQGHSLGSLNESLGNNIVGSEELAKLPLCGGTFRSRRRKRKPKEGLDLTWKEKRDKRIEKKFGKNGTVVGEDEDKRLSLELKGKGPLGVKPRVAQSKRGRELRAAAALARFATNKQEVEATKSAAEVNEDETESDEGYEEVDEEVEDARDGNGQRLMDSKGQPMIRVCEGEESDAAEAKRELTELTNLDNATRADISSNNGEKETPASTAQIPGLASDNVVPVHDTRPSSATTKTTTTEPISRTISTTSASPTRTPDLDLDASIVNCPICSMTNDAMQATCIACSHVLDPRKDPRSWACTSDACKDGSYRNAGDCGVCSICGARKQSTQVKTNDANRRTLTAGHSAHIAYL
ncbi:hypothetical protein H2198_004551 [Neophaeococcomyces mojaviensis]|uniref:Uncharacterized protein n=1 Tax=Neophaeococcomyces mojaviensis TaxID=3383035 RepID=A0ACC3A877_9EURO|nr:hypothetical protein H2198_004551 [Knufia sp. JES_112]